MVSKTLFSSATDEWETPKELFDLLDKEFHFNLDPCATHLNAKCKKYITKVMNGLNIIWFGRIFVNPPYSQIADWSEKCYRESLRSNCTVIMLIPSRTDTRYWHNYIMKAKEIRFIKGRLRFKNGDKMNSAPFPSCIVVFKDMKVSSKRRPKCSTFDVKKLNGGK